MIDFRYHLVSIIAIFFALAAGIALGAGPLKPAVDQGLATQTAELRKANQDLRDQVSALGIQAQYQESFIATVAPTLVEDELLGQRVTIVSMPDAAPDYIESSRETLELAGASVGATVAIKSSWTDPEQGEVLDDLATELAPLDVTLPEGDGWMRSGALLADLLFAPGDAPVGPVNTDLLDRYQEADLLSVDGELGAEAGLALVVAGPPYQDGDAADRNLEILADLAMRFADAGRGAVVAGAPPSAEEGGLLNAIRTGDVGDQVSTIDVAHLQTGQLATVFTLKERSEGNTGHYGIVGTTDGPMPVGLAQAAAE